MHSPISLAWNEISFQIKRAHNELELSGIRAYIFVLIRAFITIMCVFVNRACDKGNNGLFKLTVSSTEIINYEKKKQKKILTGKSVDYPAHCCRKDKLKQFFSFDAVGFCLCCHISQEARLAIRGGKHNRSEVRRENTCIITHLCTSLCS